MAAAKNVLVVDDDPEIHQLLAIALASGKCLIEHANDGLEALLHLETKPCDLVITDIRMPGLNGLDLLQRIRHTRPHTKVLVMTAESTPQSIIGALRDQAFGYFKKPFSLDEVARIVAEALAAPSTHGDIEVLSARPEWITLRLRCKLEIADRLLQFLREMDAGLSGQEQEAVGTAFRELLMNAIEHGGKSDPSKTVLVDYVRTTRAMIYKISDPGEGFSFEELKHAAISNVPDTPFGHAEIREQLGIRPGGFGILLTRHHADEVIYNQKGNEVLLVKYLTTAS